MGVELDNAVTILAKFVLVHEGHGLDQEVSAVGHHLVTIGHRGARGRLSLFAVSVIFVLILADQFLFVLLNLLLHTHNLGCFLQTL